MLKDVNVSSMVICAALLASGLSYLVANEHNQKVKDGFMNNSCPDMLVQQGSTFSLYHSKQPRVPGANPIVFNKLNDYVEYISWQRSNGIRCPVLFLQQGIDAQGNQSFKVLSNPIDPKGGPPPSRAIGNLLPKPSKNHSANAMDTAWVGDAYTQGLVDQGYYWQNEVKILVP